MVKKKTTKPERPLAHGYSMPHPDRTEDRGIPWIMADLDNDVVIK
jgi:hypothetical protein